MKDSDIRAIVLQRYYELRKEIGFYKLAPSDLGDIPLSEYERIGAQLSDSGYLEWYNSADGGLGQGRITAAGVDVIEGTAASLIGITMNDNSVRVHNSTNVAVGNQNTITTMMDVARIEQAIDRLLITEPEKADTKSLLGRISSNPSFASLISAIATMMSSQAH